MSSQKQIRMFVVADTVVVLAIIVGVVVWMRMKPPGEEGNKLPKQFDYNLEQYAKVDPALIRYDEKATIPLDMAEPRAVAVGPRDRVFVAGDKAIAVFNRGGDKLKTIKLEREPHCLAVAKAPGHCTSA